MFPALEVTEPLLSIWNLSGPGVRPMFPALEVNTYPLYHQGNAKRESCDKNASFNAVHDKVSRTQELLCSFCKRV